MYMTVLKTCQGKIFMYEETKKKSFKETMIIKNENVYKDEKKKKSRLNTPPPHTHNFTNRKHTKTKIVCHFEGKEGGGG